MNAKENALRIIRFDGPERIVTAPPTYNIAYHGCHHEPYEKTENGSGSSLPVGARWKDIWGVGWYKAMEGVMGYPHEFPLADPSDLRSYTWPDPDDERIVSKIPRLMQAYASGAAFLCGSHRCVLWERAYKVVGMEDLMVYFYTQPEFVREVLRCIMDFQIGIAAHYLDAGVEMVVCSEDLGGQRGPLLAPDIFEEFLVPEYERLFRIYRDKGVLINFHSCGSIEFLVEPLTRLGVSILNPVQATANDLKRIRCLTQGRMALQGGVSTAIVMDGPEERIRREAVYRMWQLGREGGYFCGPDQGLPFPQEHLAALHAAVERYGVYPLKNPARL